MHDVGLRRTSQLRPRICLAGVALGGVSWRERSTKGWIVGDVYPRRLQK
jgi:hypothetical protein